MKGVKGQLGWRRQFVSITKVIETKFKVRVIKGQGDNTDNTDT